MKKLYTLLTAVLFTAIAFAQAPSKISYQAVVRDASNALVTNQAVGMQISILQGSVSGSPVYVETQSPTTNLNGLVSIEIGSGNIVSGAFSAIDWSSGLYFIKTETDPTGGTNYTISGTSQLMSVPYAFHANTADSLVGGMSVTETDPIFGASVASGITALDTANWNNHTVDTQIDSTGIAALGYVAGPHTIDTDTQIDSAGIAALGYAAGPHSVDTQIDSTGIAALGYVAGPHTIDTDTQIDSAGIAAFGYVAGPHTVDTQLDSIGIAALGYVAGPHAIDTDTQLDSTGVAALGYVAGPHTVVDPTAFNGANPAVNVWSDPVPAPSSTGNTITVQSATISVPGPGKIIAIANVDVYCNAGCIANGDFVSTYVTLSTSPTASPTSGSHAFMYVNYLNTNSFSRTAVFNVTAAGSTTVYLRGTKSTLGVGTEVGFYRPQITLVFIPN